MTTDLLEYVAAASSAGLCVVPPREDGSKQPLGAWRQWQERRPTDAQLRALYQRPNRPVGFICGHVSGNLELFDFDDLAAYDRFRGLAATVGLGELVARIERGYLEETPSGGRHWFYRCTEITGNTKLARRPKRPEEQKDPDDQIQTMIETRGEGGYAVVYPSNGSVHPSGQPYRLLSGGPESIAEITPEERAALWDLARSMDEMPRPVFREPVPASPATGVRPGDDFNARASWDEVLLTAGWEKVGQWQEETFWRRPGSQNKWSATTNYRDSDLLYVFTTSTVFESEQSYSKFAAYSMLHHKGDFSEAARTLSQQGYGSQAPPVSRLVVPQHELAAESMLPTYRLQTLGELLARVGDEERGALVEDLLWERQIHWLFSPVNAGKTLLMISLGLHIADGKPFCGRAVKQGAVLFIEEDSSLSKFAEYAEKLADLFEIDIDRIPFHVNSLQGLRLTSETELRDAMAIVQTCAAVPLVAFFDACESLVPTEKYSMKEMDYLRRFLLWLIDARITPVVADHTKQPTIGRDGKEVKRKDPMDELFGGTAKKRLADFAISLSGSLKHGKLTATFVKARGEVPDPVELTYADDAGFEIVSRPASVRTDTEHTILRWLNNNCPTDWHTQPEIMAGAQVPDRSGRRALDAMTRRKLLEKRLEADRLGAFYRVSQQRSGVVFR